MKLLLCHLGVALAISRAGVARFGPNDCVSSFVNSESTCAPLQNSWQPWNSNEFDRVQATSHGVQVVLMAQKLVFK